MSKSTRYDTRDPSRGEMLLTRAIHHLWHLRAKSRPTVEQDRVFDAALETLFQAKLAVKAAIKAKSAESFKKWNPKAASE